MMFTPWPYLVEIDNVLIHITGASGSGTSTLGKALAHELGFAYLEADNYYWLPTSPPFTNKREPAGRLSSLLLDIKAQKNVVLAGSVVGWGKELESAFDLIIFLYATADIRVERLRRREIERFGVVNPAFLEWAAQYDEGQQEGRSLKKHRAWLEERSCRVIELSGNLSASETLNAVLREII